jgi:hypothetical protein
MSRTVSTGRKEGGEGREGKREGRERGRMEGIKKKR